MLDNFTDASKNLSRNPLGIIALFIVLVYGIAALVFGISGAKLSETQKWPLIWFLVFFPVLVLILFGWLVSKHHTKLYSPNDFPDKDGFFQVLSPEAKIRKLEIEANELVATSVSDKRITFDEDNTIKSSEKILLSDARADYIIAEDLVFRELEEEFQIPIQRNIALQGRGDFGYDGIIVRNTRFTLIEVKMTRNNSLWAETIARVMRNNINRLIERFPKKTDFILAIVSHGVSLDIYDRQLDRCRDYFRESEIDVDIELKHYDLDALKSKYGLTINQPNKPKQTDA